MAARKTSPSLAQGGRRIPRIAKTRGSAVTRAEFNRVIEMLNERGKILEDYGHAFAGIRHDLDLQFRRIAQLQAELDRIRRAWEKLPPG
jgi:hypothetical protein